MKPSQRLCSSSVPWSKERGPLLAGWWSGQCVPAVWPAKSPDLGCLASSIPGSQSRDLEAQRQARRVWRKEKREAGSPPCQQRQGGAGTDSRLLSQEAGLLGCPLDTP